MAISPVLSSSDHFSLIVKANGAILPPFAPITSVEVVHGPGRRFRAHLVFPDGDLPSGTFPLSDSDQFAMGQSITIQAGYGVEADMIFEGVISTHGISVGEDGSSTLELECWSLENQATVPPQAVTDTVLKLTYGVDIMEFHAKLPPVRGSVRFRGCARVNVGSTVELVGVGSKFSGKVVLTCVRHEIHDGDWTTEAAFGSDPGWLEAGSPQLAVSRSQSGR